MSEDDLKPTLAGNRSELPSGALTARELTIGQGFASTNKPDKGRITTCQAGLEPDSCWSARRFTVVGNRGEPSGESRLRAFDERYPGPGDCVRAIGPRRALIRLRE